MMKEKAGSPTPLGFSISGTEANFALYSAHADKVVLGLFRDKSDHPIKEFPCRRTGDVWHIGIPDLPSGLTYAYRCEGNPKLLYQSERWLIDPYAKNIENGKGKAALPTPFDWENDSPPQIPLEDLVIYEMHVRGFTKDRSSQVKDPGTYLGIIEKIPYLKRLGVNAIELMPIFRFDPFFIGNRDRKTKEKRVNYWGYNPLHFFVPSDWYAVNDPVQEFKTLVRALHKEGIEVILDVVYNHTGEEDWKSYSVNFRGIDHSVYYLLDEKGDYLNYTGCGNTLNANHPIVKEWILKTLCYWIEEMHVDGFRFDLASTFTRGVRGEPLPNPPILQAIGEDPLISRVKLIAEPWDAAGLYQLGSFPRWGRWSEWNGWYRDIARRFLKGTEGHAPLFANAVCGSEMIYHFTKTPLSSINFITAHDGFTLRDQVSYEQKRNEANGEENRDGNNQNDSWNCGSEGETKNPDVLILRERQMRNFLLALFISQGIPMLLMGDEYGHTREGNNNPYTQDNRINWFLWDRQNEKMFSFISSLISFRRSHPQFRRRTFLTDKEIEWFNNWDTQSRSISFMLKGSPFFYVAFNAQNHPMDLSLPLGKWKTVVRTEEDWLFHENGQILSFLQLPPYSACLMEKISE